MLSPAEEAAVVMAQWVREAPALCARKLAARQEGLAFKGLLTTPPDPPKIVVDAPCKRPYVSSVRRKALDMTALELFTRYGDKVDPAKVHGGKVAVQNPCSRCGGAGRADKWAHTGYTCFDCGGNGKGRVVALKVYTAEEIATLNERRDARRAKIAAKREAAAAVAKAAASAKFDEWEAANADLLVKVRRYRARAEFLESLLGKLEGRDFIWTDKMTDAAASCVAKIEESDMLKAASAYVGAVGERLKGLKLTVERVYDFARPVFNAPWLKETVYITTMVDADKNCFVVKSPRFRAEEGEAVELSGTVKEHTTFKDRRQTVLTRVKAKE